MKNLSAPSDLWKSWLYQLEFLKYIPDEFLRLHVGFGYYLGAPIESDLFRVSKSINGEKIKNNKIIEDYKKITKGLPNRFLLSEKDKNNKLISTIYKLGDNSIKYINTDIVRMQVDVANMYNLGVIQNAKSILEIGGGYGQLASGVLNAKKNISYAIIDFPEILEIIFRWVKHSQKNIKVIRHKETNDIKLDLHKPGLHLIPNTLTGIIKNKFDLVININSFCEMTDSQVKKYLRNINFTTGFLYTNNRDKQYQNKEISSLSKLIASTGYSIWPLNEAYNKIDYKKKVFVLYDNKYNKPNLISIGRIHGILGRETPAVN